MSGEHDDVTIAREGGAGSSPRERGARIGEVVRHVGRGDHPRVSGEHTVDNFDSLTDVGIIPA